MKRLINLSVMLLVLALFTNNVFAQEEANVQNRDMVKAQTMQGTQTQARNWVDADGDGICDNVSEGGQQQQQLKGANAKNYQKGNRKGGYGDGTGIRPQNGTGLGAGIGTGTGTCDGNGPKGAVKRSGRN